MSLSVDGIDELRPAGVELMTNPAWHQRTGRSTRIDDPEGIPIELRQRPES